MTLMANPTWTRTYLPTSASGVYARLIEKHFQHLQQFEFTHDLDRAVHHDFALQELPEILFGENDSLNNVTERHALPCAARPDFAIAVLDIEFVFSQQPLAQVAIDFINTFSQFMGGDIAEMSDLGTGLNSFFQSARRAHRREIRSDERVCRKTSLRTPSSSPDISARPSFTPLV